MTAPMTVDAVMALALKCCNASSACGIASAEGGQGYSDALDAYVTLGKELRSAVELLAQQARANALEDAAKVCGNSYMGDGSCEDAESQRCEEAILAMK